MPDTPTTVRVILCLTSQAKTRVQVNLAYLMQQLSSPLLPIPEDNLDSFKALMPELLYQNLMKQYLVKFSKEAQELSPRMIEAVDTWAEQAFHAKYVARVKKVMGEVPTSAEQSTLYGRSSASASSTAKRSRHCTQPHNIRSGQATDDQKWLLHLLVCRLSQLLYTVHGR